MRIYTIRPPSGPPASPLQRVLIAVAGLIVLGVMAFFGFFVFLAAMGLAAAVGLGLWVRAAWRSFRGGSTGQRPPTGPQTLEGEYRIVEKQDRD